MRKILLMVIYPRSKKISSAGGTALHQIKKENNALPFNLPKKSARGSSAALQSRRSLLTESYAALDF